VRREAAQIQIVHEAADVAGMSRRPAGVGAEELDYGEAHAGHGAQCSLEVFGQFVAN